MADPMRQAAHYHTTIKKKVEESFTRRKNKEGSRSLQTALLVHEGGKKLDGGRWPVKQIRVRRINVDRKGTALGTNLSTTTHTHTHTHTSKTVEVTKHFI